MESLWSLLNDNISLIIEIKVMENTWNVLVKVVSQLCTAETEMGVHNLRANFVEIGFPEVELASWSTLTIITTTLKCIDLNNRSHEKIIMTL